MPNQTQVIPYTEQVKEPGHLWGGGGAKIVWFGYCTTLRRHKRLQV